MTMPAISPKNIGFCLPLCALLVLAAPLFAQTELLPVDHSLQNRLTKRLYSTTRPMHTAIQPFEFRDLSDGNNVDSLLATGRVWDTSGTNWLTRKLFGEHLAQIQTDDYRLTADFYPDFKFGKDLAEKRSTNLNTRAVAIAGSVGSSFSFSTEFYENQEKFPGYIDNVIQRDYVVPGQGFIKYYDPNTFDFSYASAVISYRPSRYLGIQAGHGKNFLGDGYRSLLLSDVAFNYPYLKLTADIWKIKYMCMWAELQHISDIIERGDILPWEKKGGVFQYLDLQVTDRLSVGVFESIIWRQEDSVTNRGFDLNYLNPIIFLHPVGYSLGSPDNALVGMNWHYTLSDGSALYGQFMLDEFVIGELVKNSGWGGNKYGMQLGVKTAEPLNLRGLYLQGELNVISPYSYQAIDPVKNHAHYRQSLEHPLGANFYEWLAIGEYAKGRVEFRLQCDYALYGADSTMQSNVGKDVYMSYLTHTKDYGNFIGQGIHTQLVYAQFQAAYVLNPLNNLRVEASCVYRQLSSKQEYSRTLWVEFGIRGSLRNIYYDF